MTRFIQLLVATAFITQSSAAASHLRAGKIKGRGTAGIYVATNGSDANSGSMSSPLLTLEAARDSIRANGVSPANSTVWIRGGTYTRTGSFDLTSLDSGTAQLPITYRAYPGETVIFTGALPITNFVAVTDPTTIARLASPNVIMADLSSLGLTYGDLTNRGATHDRTDIRSGYMRPWMIELYSDDARQQLARWPNQDKSREVWAWTTTPVPPNPKEGATANWFTYRESNPSAWALTEDVWVHGGWTFSWADSYERVTSIDGGTKVITTDRPGDYGFSAGSYYEALNVLEELDRPGEWVIDRTNHRLYFWPPTATPNSSTTLSALASDFVTLTGVDYVTFRGITFQCGRSSGMSLTNSSHARILGCTFRNLGNAGIVVGNALFNNLADKMAVTHDYQGGTDNQIIGCQFLDIGEGGVALSGGNRVTLTGAGHSVSNCYFRAYNTNIRSYRPAVKLDGVGSTVSHCTMHDSPHQAIWFSGNDHLIQYNHIYDVCLDTDDAGAIYCVARDWKQQGTIIRYNFIDDSWHYGIYLDDFTSGVSMIGNIIRVYGTSFLVGGGRDNVIANNLLIGSSGNGNGWTVSNRGVSWAFESIDNLVSLVEQLDYTSAPYSKYSGMSLLFDDVAAYKANKTSLTLTNLGYAKGNSVFTNIMVDAKEHNWDIDTNAVAQAKNYVYYSFADFNGFAVTNAVETKTWTLNPSTEAVVAGFVPIEWEAIGSSLTGLPVHPPIESRAPFLTNAIAIPGTIQIEDFDEGENLNAFHKSLGYTYGNYAWGSGVYRPHSRFAIWGSVVNGTRVYTMDIEYPNWVEYSVSATATADYTITMVPGTSFSGNWHIDIDGTNATGQLNSGNPSAVVNISAGEHVLRLVPESGASGRLDYITFE